MVALPDKIYCCSVPHFTGKEQAHLAAKMGRTDRDIFIDGRGAENFSACIAAIRGPGTLGLPGGLREFGTSRKAIMEKVRALRGRLIQPYNLKTGLSDTTELLDEAIAQINNNRIGSDKRRPKRIGRRGGFMKGIRAQEHRDSIMDENIVRRICTHPNLSWDERAEILGGPPFSASTLRRLYGDI